MREYGSQALEVAKINPEDIDAMAVTKGNIAVADDKVIRFLAFLKGFKNMYDSGNEVLENKYNEFRTFILQDKKEGDADTREILDLKALIRRGEAKAACQHWLTIEKYSFSESSVLRNRICKKIANQSGEC